MQRCALSREARVWQDMDAQVEIAAPGCPLSTLISDADTRTLVHSGRNLHLNAFGIAIRLCQLKDA